VTKPPQYGISHQDKVRDGPRKLLPALQFLAVIIFPVFLVVALQRISIKQPLQAGDRAPDLILRDLSGRPVNLANLYRQRSAILFFSPDCSHCDAELRNVERLRAACSDGIAFLLVTRGDRAKTRSLLDSLGVGIPTAVDAEGVANEAFGVFTAPAWFLIDSHGIVRAGLFGERPLDKRKEQLESFLRATAEGL